MKFKVEINNENVFTGNLQESIDFASRLVKENNRVVYDVDKCFEDLYIINHVSQYEASHTLYGKIISPKKIYIREVK